MASESKATYRRRRYFINRGLQGRYMATFGIPMALMVAFMLFAIYLATVTAVESAGRTMRRDIESTIALELQTWPDTSVQHYRQVVAGIGEYANTFSQGRTLRRDLLPSLLWVCGIGILFVAIQVTLLTVFFSHKIAGPVYRFEVALRRVIAGDYACRIRLRKRDELQELAATMNEALKATQARFMAVAQAENDPARTAAIVRELRI